MFVKLLICLWIGAGLAWCEGLPLRVVAANLTSDRHSTYSPDNANHSNPEGAGARILKALKPDVVMIQEFNTSIPARQWVNQTLGREFHFIREEGMQIPNGVISRFPIIASGSWDDPALDNREFAWAQIRLPGGRDLWAVSVHFHTKSATSRLRQAEALVRHVRANLPTGAMLAIGGDLNTRTFDEPCFKLLKAVVVIPDRPPADEAGNPATNHPRNRPYDWVLCCRALDRHAVPVKLAGKSFPHGLVFDSRVFSRLDQCHPVQKGDSGLPQMQHMAVVRDFLVPGESDAP